MCDFAWYGATAAHGLRVVGSCTRCGGELDYLVEDEAQGPPAVSDRLAGMSPASVMGTPVSWAR